MRTPQMTDSAQIVIEGPVAIVEGQHVEAFESFDHALAYRDTIDRGPLESVMAAGTSPSMASGVAS
jgi:hypothetical protein